VLMYVCPSVRSQVEMVWLLLKRLVINTILFKYKFTRFFKYQLFSKTERSRSIPVQQFEIYEKLYISTSELLLRSACLKTDPQEFYNGNVCFHQFHSSINPRKKEKILSLFIPTFTGYFSKVDNKTRKKNYERTC